MLWDIPVDFKNVKQWKNGSEPLQTRVLCYLCRTFHDPKDMVLYKDDTGNVPLCRGVCEEKMASTHTWPEELPPRPKKLWLDDVRPSPDATWVVVKTVPEAIREMLNRPFYEISLDHDLGDVGGEDGIVLLNWLERVAAGVEAVPSWFQIPIYITIHSANPVGRENMDRAIASIRRWEARREEEMSRT